MTQRLRLEPEWWADARKMKARGRTYDQIAELLGKSRSAVTYCLAPKVRQSAIAAGSRRYAELKAAGRAPKRRIDPKRQFIRRLAREEFRASGSSNLADLRKIYARMGCL